jgi:serine/threonine protein kinase
MNTDIRALQVGQLISDYKIEGVLGQGAFGITYLAVDTMLNRKFAVKEYYPREFAHRDSTLTVHAAGSKDDQDTFTWGLTRFLDEAKLLARFDHPNIIAVRRFFEANGTAYLVMDYCDGIPLDELIKKNGPLSENEINKIIGPLLEGLKQVHASNFLHRDIKPANIFIRSDGSPVLLDFGAARQELVNHSKSVTSLATPGYAAFEQYSTQGKQGPWTDIYGLAATLYRAVTGEKPLDAPDRILDDTLVPASIKAKGKYSDRLLTSIDKGMAVRPVDRPQSIIEWEAQLFDRSIAKTITKDLPQDTSTQQSPPKLGTDNVTPNKKNLFLIFGLALVALIAIGSYFLTNKDSEQKSIPKPIQEPIQKSKIEEVKAPDIKSQTPKNEPYDDKRIADKSASPKEEIKLPPCKEPFSVNTWTNCIGKTTFPNGDFFNGGYKDGKPDGRGKYVYASGDMYEGEYKNGVIEGQGSYTFANGEKYTGQWKNGKNNGQGTYKHLNGGVYIGNFKDNLREGKGTFTLPTGLKFVGIYAGGKAYEGTITYPDGSKYVGTLNADGKYNGQGTIYSSNGTKGNSGSWVNGEFMADRNDNDAIFTKCKAKSAEVNAGLPKKIDNITNWISTYCELENGSVSYVMKMQITSDDKFTNEQLNAIAYTKVKNSLCSDPKNKEYIKLASFNYVYTAKDGAYMGSLKYPRNSCQ